MDITRTLEKSLERISSTEDGIHIDKYYANDVPVNVRLELSGSGVDTESAKERLAFRFQRWVKFDDRLGSEMLRD